MRMMTSRGDTVAAGIGYERSAARADAVGIARQRTDSMRSTPLCANNSASHRQGKIKGDQLNRQDAKAAKKFKSINTNRQERQARQENQKIEPQRRREKQTNNEKASTSFARPAASARR